MSEQFDLDRFRQKQKYAYDQALREIRSGKKQSHWIWYIFPQLRGLGRSPMSAYFGISGMAEAKAYLADPVLGQRLTEVSEALLQLEDQNAARIFGYPDDLKVRSCMTLFDQASEREDNVFRSVLDAYYHGEQDPVTLQLLDAPAP